LGCIYSGGGIWKSSWRVKLGLSRFAGGVRSREGSCAGAAPAASLPCTRKGLIQRLLQSLFTLGRSPVRFFANARPTAHKIQVCSISFCTVVPLTRIPSSQQELTCVISQLRQKRVISAERQAAELQRDLAVACAEAASQGGTAAPACSGAGTADAGGRGGGAKDWAGGAADVAGD